MNNNTDCQIVARGKLYAGAFIGAPIATIRDKFVFMLKKSSILTLFKFFLTIMQNNIAEMEQVEIIKTNLINIFSDYEKAI